MCRAVKVLQFIEATMREKGFATIFGLCLILIIALVVKGIQEAEANHAREVLNFEMEQVLQSAAESSILEAAESLSDDEPKNAGKILSGTKIIKQGEPPNEITFEIKFEVFGERGKIYIKKVSYDGVYFMSYASTESPFLSKKIYRRAYAYVLDADDMTIHFMEFP